ncbi:hypothetical protein [uncultured Desulfovibrio sp.]|uniref:hypothetical protein n=1 Tax=uncultured Desulfovibrio sp. TaxID=167968 RepID=UPI00260EA816|nr:hypothetical protein [uncultured Desulfovibrio sp.]
MSALLVALLTALSSGSIWSAAALADSPSVVAPLSFTDAAAEEKAVLPPAEAPVEVRELWTGSLYTSSFRVGMCVSARGAVRGVLHLRLANGQVDVYHFNGSVKDNAIEASHSSGHTFRGRLSAPDKVEGTINLKNGMKIRLEGKRIQDVSLAPEDCAPLPE